MRGENEEQRELNLLGFFLDKWEYGLPISMVREIIRIVEITPIPEAPAFMPGVIDLRGEIVPIVDLRIRLRFAPQEHHLSTPIIISEVGDKAIGIIVDRVSEVLSVSKDDVRRPSSEVPLSDDLLHGVLRLDGRLLLLLDLNKVLTFKPEKLVKTGARLLRHAKKEKQNGKKAG